MYKGILLGNKLVVSLLPFCVGFLHVFENSGELETHVIVRFLEHIGVVRVFRVEVFDGLFREGERLVHDCSIHDYREKGLCGYNI